MKKVDFTQIAIFVGIDKSASVVKDIRKELADMIYISFFGLEAHALAYKIYGSKGEIELDENECKLLNTYVEQQGSPSLIDSIREALK